MQNNISIKSGTYFIEDILSHIRSWFYKDWIKIFIVDHLWLIKAKWKDTRNNEIWEWTSKLKQLSLQLNINVILLVQMNRWDKINKNAIPTMDWLRDSWNIEQDADNVILLHRNSDDEWTMDNNMTIYVQKNRVSWIKWNCSVIVYPNTFSIIEWDLPQISKNTTPKKEVEKELNF